MCRKQCVLALVALCVGLAHSWDVAISNGDQLEFYTNEIKTDTVRFNSQNLTALAYDEVQNMILYVDKQSNNDAICGYDISSNQYKYLTGRNGRNIQGLAFDPVTELLFFTDTNERSINWISLKSGSKNNVNGNVLFKMDDGIPTDIAVDSCRGYIYWLNTNLTTPTIERAQLNGSGRELVINLNSVPSINPTYKLEPHSLAVDPQSQKIYWIEPKSSSLYCTCSADLNGKNKDDLMQLTPSGKENPRSSNRLSVSKKFLFRASFIEEYVWGYPNTDVGIRDASREYFNTLSIAAGIVANYKVSDQIQGMQNCKTLTSLVQNNYVTNNLFKIATEYDATFCVHGMKVTGQSLCKCAPGYIGERCDVSVCENYCIQGNCSVNDEGLPKCRCNAGYSGVRCEVDACYGYCLNNGVCWLNEEDEPFCQCAGSHEGSRCETVKNDSVANTPKYSLTERNLTLADLFLNWREPISKMTVIIEP